MSSLAQYVVYLIVGGLYYVLLATFMSVAAGFSWWVVVLILLALILGGYAPGISFAAPRLAAAIGVVAALPFLVWTATIALSESPSLWWTMLPAAGVIGLSARVLYTKPEAVWSHQTDMAWRVILGALALAPAALATWMIGWFVSRLL